MNLEVLPSDFGLPSVDAECLQFLAACKFCAAPVTVERTIKTWTAKNGKLPTFSTGTEPKRTICDFSDFCSHLYSHGSDLVLDGHLSESQRSQVFSYSSLVRAHLLPAYLYSIWIDEHNLTQVTNHWYAQHVTFPFNQWYVANQRRAAQTLLLLKYPGEDVTMKQVEYAVIKQAKSCLNQLSAKLGDRKYFFGDKPSSLDALVFGYVAPLLKMPLPSDHLQQHVKACANLVRLVETVISIYMPLSDEELTNQRSGMANWEMRRAKAQEMIRREKELDREAKKQSRGLDEDAEEFRVRDKIVFGLLAGLLTVAAAVHLGVVQVDVVKSNATSDDYTNAPMPDGYRLES